MNHFNLFFVVKQQVAWIRHRDLHLLTVGNVTYTSDARFASNPPSSAYQNDDGGDALTSWSLQIRNVQPKDQGVYECQVGMTPHVSRFIHLAVVGKYIPRFSFDFPIDHRLLN